MITRRDSSAFYLRGADGVEARLPQAGIKDLQPSPVSLMPQRLDLVLHQEELRDLLAFLQGLK